MGLFDRIRGRPKPPPPPPAPPPPPPLTLNLRPAPRYQPLPGLGPTTGASPIDQMLASRWLAFQQKTPGGTWQAFMNELRTENAKLFQDITAVTAELRSFT